MLLGEVEDGIGTMLVLATFAVMLAGVVFRYVFNDSLTWTEEFSRYALVMMTFVGIATGFRKQVHIRIDALLNMAPRWARPLEIFGLVTSIAFLGFLIVQAVQLSRVLGSSRSAALNMPMSWLYIAVAIALAWGLLRAVQALVAQFKGVSE
jgi:TRAP-type C4-dicarboxylate transport system permease small subunit